MYMFLPFLVALFSAGSIVAGNKKLGYISWALLIVISALWFNYHATDPLTLSF